jgi:hypothetical protein
MSQIPEPANHDHQARSDGRALAADFDHDPERFAANQLATQNFSIVGDVHDRVADRLAKITNGPILDLGGGNGTLAKSLAKHRRSAIVVDRAEYVRSAPRPAVQADAIRLPFRAECDPEFASVFPHWGEPFSFDAEIAQEIISDHFTIIEVVTWDAPAVWLPDGAAVALFLRGRGLSADEASLQAGRWKVPLTVTKRGCLIWARRV